MTSKIQPVQLASGFTTLVLDWLVFATTMETVGWWWDMWYVATLAGSVLTLVLVTVFESRAGVAARNAYLRGLIAALAVAVPLPLIGTLIGLAGVAWAVGASRRKARG